MEGLIKDTLKKLNKPDFVDSCEVVDSENGLDSEEILLEIGSGMCWITGKPNTYAKDFLFCSQKQEK